MKLGTETRAMASQGLVPVLQDRDGPGAGLSVSDRPVVCGFLTSCRKDFIV